MSDLPWVVYGARPRYTLEVAEIVRRRGEVLEVAIDNLVEAEPVDGSLGVIPVRSRLALPALIPRARFVLSAGLGSIRRLLAEELVEAGATLLPSLVDPTAVVASSSVLARGTTVNALAVIASMTRVGAFVQINRSVSVGHDCVIGDFATIGPGAILTGFVDVGVSAFIGAGAVIRPRTTIGAGATVGAGAVVTRDVGEFEVVVGNPARALPARKRPSPDRQP